MVSIHWLASFAVGPSPDWLLYVIPLTIGVAQWAFLSQELRWWGLLWLPSCLVGLFLSFLGSWWFLCVLGTGIGVAQAPILALSGFRRWWVWVPASGFGWFIGLLLGSCVQDMLGAVLTSDVARMSVLYGVTALAYGTLTAAALKLMPQARATARCSRDGSEGPGEAEPSDADLPARTAPGRPPTKEPSAEGVQPVAGDTA